MVFPFSAPAPILTKPDIHENLVAFSCEGDIWVGNLSTGKADRLTTSPGKEERAKFSPDGKSIAFTATYDGIRELYVMPTTGGAPTRLTYTFDYAYPMDWTPDGKSVLFASRGVNRSFQFHTISAEGGPSTRLPIEFASHASYSSQTGKFAFTRFLRSFDSWFYYEGGMQNHLWSANMGEKSFKKISSAPGTSEHPAWAGNRVFFANEQDGMFRLMSVSSSGGKEKTHAGPYEFEIRELGTDGSRIIYEKASGLELFDPATGSRKDVTFSLLSDLPHTRPFLVDPAKHTAAASITPTGKRVLIETRGQIVSAPAGKGETRLWKSQPGVRLKLPEMSPDGKKVAYVSDEGGEEQLWISDPDGSNAKQLTKDSKRQLKNYKWSRDGKWIGLNDSEMRLRLINTESGESKEIDHAHSTWNGTSFDISADSKWLAYGEVNGITHYSRLVLYEIATGKKTRLGSGFTNDVSPAFSSDGKHLLFLSTRSLGVAWDSVLNQMNTKDVMVPCILLLQKDGKNPLTLTDTVEPVKEEKQEEKKPEEIAKKPEEKKPGTPGVDLDGLYERLILLPGMSGSYAQIAQAGTRVLVSGGGKISFYDLKAKKAGEVTSGGAFSLSADGKKLLIGTRVVDASGTSVSPSSGTVSFGGLQLRVDPKEEWEQMFWDAWRLLRDYFYVANMHGLDWKAIGQKYHAMLPQVRSRDELDILIKWMQAELGSSHQYLRGGDEQLLTKTVRGGHLGIEVVPDGGHLKISTIYGGDGVLPSERSPLLEAGMNVSEGDYLLAIGGQDLTSSSNYKEHLVGRAGQTVSVKIGKSADDKAAKTYLVKPVASEARMKQLSWVEKNRAYVDKASNGRIGYIYLRAMSTPDMADFIKQFYPLRDKQALLIDTRFNGGGNTQSVMNRILAQPLIGMFNMRASEYGWSRQGDFFLGPMACLQNEFNVSCGEEFPHAFRKLGLGKVIGRRTYGGEVGSSPGWPLADGGVVSVPNYGMFTIDDGWVIEGPGVSPDIDVESDPNAYARGTDPQLDASIKHLLAEAKANPFKYPLEPPAKIQRRRRG